jgi:hypothetical protein
VHTASRELPWGVWMEEAWGSLYQTVHHSHQSCCQRSPGCLWPLSFCSLVTKYTETCHSW